MREQLNRGVVPEGIDLHCLAGLIKVQLHNFKPADFSVNKLCKRYFFSIRKLDTYFSYTLRSYSQFNLMMIKKVQFMFILFHHFSSI